MASQEPAPGFKSYNQASAEPYAYPLAQNTTRVSVASDGTQANGDSYSTSISADGRYVAFASRASNLAAWDANWRAADVFVHDRQSGETTRVSVASDGTQANNDSFAPSISADGRYVAFESYATNLVAGDTNGMNDVFVHDRQSGETTRVSLASDGAQAYGNSHEASISADGRYVAFGSYASNLVAGDTNGMYDVFVHDRQTSTTTRGSLASDGSQAIGPSTYLSISADGRYVAFASWASNLVAGDTNEMSDIFIYDRQASETSRVSLASDGSQTNSGSYEAFISANGRFVVFTSAADNLTAGDTNGVDDIFVHDRQTGETVRVSVASDGSQTIGSSSNFPSISADGRYVTFYSYASNLVPGDTNGWADTFVHDLRSGETIRIPNAPPGFEPNDASYASKISGDGRVIAFSSLAKNLVTGDTNGFSDIFVYDKLGKTAPVNGAGGQPISLTLSWNDEDDQTASYEYCLGTVRGICNITDWTSTGSNTSVALSDLTAGATYYWQVRTDTAIEADGGAWWSFTTTFNKTAPADGATNQPIAPTLSWNTSAGATSYEYCYSSTPGPCTKWNSVGANTSVTLNGLAANYTYYWQARAVNPGGVVEADNGTWWSFTTTGTATCTWPAYTPPASATFGDVPMTVGHWSWVERLANATITAGCGAGNYCPFNEVNRAQIAIFLLRAKHCGSSYTPPAVGDSTGFGDVPLDASYAPWVKQLAAEGVTAGCGGGNFCPQTVVNRAQMAIFLLRARHGATYSPPAVGATTGFGDVPLDASYAAWVKQLAAEGVTAGCGNGNFCPLQNVNRAQMATFLVRAFGLP
jgi:tricorn protease-like protein